MSKLHFERLRYRNFMSIGDNPIDIKLDKTDATLVCGHNGAGKSTILEALSFVLFNKSHRGIKKPTLVNSINQKDCVVEVWFKKGSDQYHVLRSISPNSFIITKNDETLDVDSSVLDGQKYFESHILGANFNSFKRLVIVGAGDYKPFMSMSATERRQMVEVVLGIGIFSAMNDILKSRISDKNVEITNIRHEIEKLDLEIRKYEELIELKAQNTQEQIDDLKAEGKEVFSRLKELKENPVEFDEEDFKRVSAEYAAAAKAAQDAEYLLRSATNDVEKIRKEIDRYSEEKICVSCGQDLDEEYHYRQKQAIQTDLSAKEKIKRQREEDVDGCRKSEAELRSVKEVLATKSEEHRKQVSRVSESHNRLKIIRTKIKKLEDDLFGSTQFDGESDNAPYHQILDSIRTTRRDLASELNQAQATLNTYNRAASLLKDDGIKTNIIRKYLPILNGLTNQFLKSLNFNIKFEVDEKFKEALKTRYKNEYTYMNFSNGERQRLDLAIMFAWLMVARMKNSLSTNLLILDEVEGHLDKHGAEDVLNISEQLGDDMNVFLISHQTGVEDRVKSIIQFEKVNGFTKIAS